MKNLVKKHFVSAVVTQIGWERIWLHLEVQLSFSQEKMRKNGEFAFYLVDNRTLCAHARLQVVEAEENDRYHLRVNVTNPGNCRCLPSGLYTLVVVQQDCQVADAEILPDMVSSLGNLSRNFLYGAGEKAYTVTFLIGESDTELPFRICTLAAIKTNVGEPVLRKKKTFSEVCHQFYKRQSRILMKNIYGIRHGWHRHFGKKKGILFLSEQRDSISPNLQAVRDRIYQRGLEQDYQILESYRQRNQSGFSKYIKWFEVVNRLADADYVFIDDHAPFLDWFVLDKDTALVQLWHAGAGFKSSGYSRWGHLGCPGPYGCHRQYSYGIAGSKAIRHFFSEVWGINDSMVLPTGMPRMDEYLNEDYQKKKKEELYKQFPICNGKKVILFAPTYRGNDQLQAGYPYHVIDFEKLYNVCGDEYVVLFKMHPWVVKSVPIPENCRDKFVDVNTYPNINDLFYIADLLITDYSSNIFEYSLMGKPMLFFAYDEILYSFTRGFHRDYQKSAPGKVCHTFDEVVKSIEDEDYEFEKVERYVKQHFDFTDCHAADRVIDWIVLGNLPEDVKEEIQTEHDLYATVSGIDFSDGRKPAVK